MLAGDHQVEGLGRISLHGRGGALEGDVGEPGSLLGDDHIIVEDNAVVPVDMSGEGERLFGAAVFAALGQFGICRARTGGHAARVTGATKQAAAHYCCHGNCQPFVSFHLFFHLSFFIL